MNLPDHVTIFHCQLSVYLLQVSENMQIIDALGFMAIPVMEFIELLRIGVMWRCQKVPKFDFQTEFSISKIIRIILFFVVVEKYQFWSTFFLIDIF